MGGASGLEKTAAQNRQKLFCARNIIEEFRIADEPRRIMKLLDAAFLFLLLLSKIETQSAEQDS